MNRSEHLSQDIDAYRTTRWISGVYAGDEATEHRYIPGTRLDREWVGTPKPWKATKPYSVYRFRQWPQSYAVSVTYPGYGVFEEEGIGYIDPPDVQSIVNGFSHPTIVADTMNAALKIIAGAQWAAPVFLSELDDAGKLVGKLARVYSRGANMIMKAIVDRRYRRWLYNHMRRYLSLEGFGEWMPNLTGTLSGAWLEWRYAVQTLALDAKDAAEAAAEVMRDTPRTTERAMAHRTQVTGAVDQVFGSGPLRYGNVYTCYGSSHKTYTTWVEARAWITAVRQYNPPLAQIQAVGMLNWPANVWEMLPGSFIADWVLNLGSYLEACSALVGWNVADSGYSVTKRVAGEVAVNFSVSPMSSATDLSYSSEPVRFEASQYNRSAWNNPQAVWSPAFRMSTERWLDAAALIRSVPLAKLKIV